MPKKTVTLTDEESSLLEEEALRLKTTVEDILSVESQERSAALKHKKIAEWWSIGENGRATLYANRQPN